MGHSHHFGHKSLCIIIVFVFFKEIQAILYDREIALSVGIPEKQLYYLIVFMLGLTIAVSMRLIGALLGCPCPLTSYCSTVSWHEVTTVVCPVLSFRSYLRTWRLPLFSCRGHSCEFVDYHYRIHYHYALRLFLKGGLYI
jgi:hypothetical protein